MKHPKLRETAMRRLTLAASAMGLLACGQAEAPPAPTDTLRVSVAPLSLTSVEEVTYGLTVRSATQIVWSESGLTSTQYGDGASALTYIGPCDATDNPHTVELVIENIRADGVDLAHPSQFINPAPAGQPLARSGVTCVENADVRVDFDVTVMRNAQQGFFDIAVNFDDIYCSAKLDCRAELLHVPGTSTRDATAIVAFACTAGPDKTTSLRLSDLALVCDDGDAGTPPVVHTLPATAGPGQHGSVAPGVFRWAVYQGDEELTVEGHELEKCYWNRAIGLDREALAGQSCRVNAVGTATATGDLEGLFAPGSAYPVVRWDVEVLSADGQLCANHPLNGSPVGVTTEYVTAQTDPQSLAPMPGVFVCGGGPAVPSVTCGAAAQVSVGEAGVTVTTAGGSAIVALPEGFSLGQSCCTDGCCADL